MVRFAYALVGGLVAAQAQAQTGGFFNAPIPTPDIAIDFAGDYSPQGKIPSLLTTARASAHTCADLSGNYHQVGNNVACYTNQGLLVEENRTNSIRNNTMAGAVAGTPGTLPTNWIVAGLNGLSQQIVGTGIENGISYMDIRFSGTTNATSSTQVKFESTTQIAASSGQTWSAEAFIYVSAGSLSNITTPVIQLVESNSSGSGLANSSSSFAANTTGPLGLKRVTVTRTLNQATTAFVEELASFNYNSGAVIDITLRIGWPQLEQGAFSTSPVPTTNAAVNRAADNISLTTPPTFSTNGHTLYAQWVQPQMAVNAFPDILEIDDGSTNNRDLVFISQASGKATRANSFVGGSNIGAIESASSYVLGATAKAAYAIVSGRQSFASNGAFSASHTGSFSVPVVTAARIGGQSNSGNYANGYIANIKIWGSQALTDNQLVRLTQ